jgi:hypothetical protein
MKAKALWSNYNTTWTALAEYSIRFAGSALRGFWVSSFGSQVTSEQKIAWLQRTDWQRAKR